MYIASLQFVHAEEPDMTYLTLQIYKNTTNNIVDV